MRFLTFVLCLAFLLPSFAFADAGSGVIRQRNDITSEQVKVFGPGRTGYYRFGTTIANTQAFYVRKHASVCVPSNFNSAVVSIWHVISGYTDGAAMKVPITSSQLTLTGAAGEDCASLVTGEYYINVETPASSGTSIVKITGYEG